MVALVDADTAISSGMVLTLLFLLGLVLMFLLMDSLMLMLMHLFLELDLLMMDFDKETNYLDPVFL